MATVELVHYSRFYGIPDIGPAEEINLLSAAPDGCLALVLAFDRCPDGDVTALSSYALAALDGGTLPVVESAARDDDPEHPYLSRLVRLTFSEPGTGGASYSVTISGLTGPSGEALGTDAAEWTAPEPESIALLTAEQESQTSVLLTTDRDVEDSADLRDPDSYTVTSVVEGAEAVVVTGASRVDARTVRVFVLPAPTARLTYTATVVEGAWTGPDGGTNEAGSASFVALAAESSPWIPPDLAITIDGTPIDGSRLTLVRKDGEPVGADIVRAAYLSLACHRLAAPDDALPDPWGDPPDRRGWMGDSVASVPGDLFGSRLWLLHRARGADVPLRAEEYVREALAWMVEDGLAASVSCTATASGTRLDMKVTIAKPPKGQGSFVGLAWNLWEGL